MTAIRSPRSRAVPTDPLAARALRLSNASRQVDTPQPGYYAMRLVKDGPQVPAVIWIGCPWTQASDDVPPFEWCRHADRRRPMLAKIADRDADPMHVWLSGRPIGLARFRYLVALAAWATRNAPHEPAANPRERIDLAALPSVF